MTIAIYSNNNNSNDSYNRYDENDSHDDIGMYNDIYNDNIDNNIDSDEINNKHNDIITYFNTNSDNDDMTTESIVKLYNYSSETSSDSYSEDPIDALLRKARERIKNEQESDNKTKKKYVNNSNTCNILEGLESAFEV